MFIKNTQKKAVELASFDGFVFKLQPGTSAIWDKAGEQLLKVHKIESRGLDIYGRDNGTGLPALMESDEATWKRNGKQLAEVSRYQINAKLIPRVKLIKVALDRGVSHNRISEYQLDETIDIETIANDINSMDIPEEIKRPVNIEETVNESISA